MHKPSLLSLLVGAVGLSSACVVTSSDNGDTGPTPQPTTQADTDPVDPSTSGPDETGEPDPTSDPDDTGEEEETEDAADETGNGEAVCGWGQTGDPTVPEGYICGGEGEDPDNRYPIECPEGLQEGAECEELTGVGCCDANGDVWYCWDEDGVQTLVKEDC